MAIGLLVMTGFGCGQRQRLRADEHYPNLVRTVTLPAGLELWFQYTEGQRIALWARQTDGYAPPIYIASSTPVQLNTTQKTVHIRFAYTTGMGVGPVSPPTVIKRVQPSKLPTVTCKRLEKNHEVSVRSAHRDFMVLF